MNPTFRQFFDAVCAGLEVQPSTPIRRGLACVAIVEGATASSAAGRFNPLNSVIRVPGSVAFNSVGVQDYGTYDRGVAGTVALLKQPRWADTLTAMRTARTRNPILDTFAAEYRTWGGNGAATLLYQMTTKRVLTLLDLRMP